MHKPLKFGLDTSSEPEDSSGYIFDTLGSNIGVYLSLVFSGGSEVSFRIIISSSLMEDLSETSEYSSVCKLHF